MWFLTRSGSYLTKRAISAISVMGTIMSALISIHWQDLKGLSTIVDAMASACAPMHLRCGVMPVLDE
jgi:hypothetical protein